jgi:hypothetical protein
LGRSMAAVPTVADTSVRLQAEKVPLRREGTRVS